MTAFVVASGDSAEVFEAVDCAFNNVASFVGNGVKARRRSSALALTQAMLHCIAAFRADATDATAGHGLTRLASAIGTIDTYASWTLARTSFSQSGHVNCIEYWFKLGYVGTLSRSDDQ